MPPELPQSLSNYHISTCGGSFQSVGTGGGYSSLSISPMWKVPLSHSSVLQYTDATNSKQL